MVPKREWCEGQNPHTIFIRFLFVFDKEYHEIISLDYEENIIAPSPGNCLHAFIM